MAKSRNTQKKYETKKFWNEFIAKQPSRGGKQPKQVAPHDMMFDFDKNPNWWDHLHTTEKNRRKERDLLAKVLKGDKNADSYFDPWKKPKVWYW